MTSATISSSSPSPAANPAIAALAAANGVADASAAGGANLAEGDASTRGNSFAALLQKTMGKPAADTETNTRGIDPTLLLATEEAPDELQTLGAELAALLPFLEAAGLVAKSPKIELADSAQGGISLVASSPTEAAPTDPGLLLAESTILTPAAILANTPISVTPLPEDLSQAGQATPTLLAATAAVKLDAASQPQNTAAGAAIIADGAAITTPLDQQSGGHGNSGRDGKANQQANFATQLTTAQSTAATAATARPDNFGQAIKEARSAADRLPPGLAQLQSGQPSSAAAFAPANAQATQHTASPALPVTTPVGAAQWNQEIGDKVVWMASRMESRADLVLTPPQMGRVEVSLTVNGDQANATFTSANPAVREALEAAMPRLREILAEAGIQLGQAQVGAENARQSAQQEKNGDNFTSNHGAERDDAGLSANAGKPLTSTGLRMGRGLVDTFA